MDQTSLSVPAVYKLLRRRVEHEDSTINARVTWQLLIQGALYAFFFSAIQAGAKGLDSAKGGDSGELIVLTVPILGLWICLLLRDSLLAALKEIDICEREYKAFLETTPLPFGVPESLVGRHKTHKSGNTFARLLPLICSLPWILGIGIEIWRHVDQIAKIFTLYR